MAITSYPRVTVTGTGAVNNPQNGQGLMILNPSTGKYEAATAATFAGGGGGGSATAANQVTEIARLDTIILNTNSGRLNDISYNVTTTGNATNLPSQASIKITLINLSTNTAPMEITVGSGGTILPLEIGYSIVLNISNADRITVKQTGGEAEVLHYIVSN